MLPEGLELDLQHRRLQLLIGHGLRHLLLIDINDIGICEKLLSQGGQAIIGRGCEQLCADIMLHQNERGKRIHQGIELHGGEGNRTDEAEKDAHGGQEPLIQHDARKEEGGNNGAFLCVQLFGRRAPDFFDIHIDPFIEIYKNAVNLLIAFQ